MRWLVVVCGLAVFGQAGAAPRSYSLPSMVVTPAENVAFAIEADGISAIEITTGKVKWKSKIAVRPVGRTGDALVALDPKGTMIVLDPATGAAHKKCPKLNFSLVVREQIGPNGHISWRATSEDNQINVYVESVFGDRERNQKAPVHRGEAPVMTQASFAVDVTACKVDRTSDTVPDQEGFRLSGTTPGGITITIEPDPANRVRRMKGAQPLPSIDFKSKGQRGTLSLSDQHFYVVDDLQRPKHLTVYDLDSGKSLGVLASVRKQDDLPLFYFVVGSHILYDASVVDLRTSKLVWSRTHATPVPYDNSRVLKQP